ncbi:MAG TPA: hypothetical protein VK988_06175 [Acidimicrobiales bacterium]|nr:hypothetical protein [Acidimicrobiales bacterium]
MLDALLKTYGRSDLCDRAVRAAATHANDGRDLHAAELAAVEAEVGKAEASIERYLRAFEDNTMPEARCSERVRVLGKELAALRARRDELGDALDATAAVPPSEEVLAELRARIAEAIDKGTDAERKVLVQALVHEVNRHRPTTSNRSSGIDADAFAPWKVLVCFTRVLGGALRVLVPRAWVAKFHP